MKIENMPTKLGQIVGEFVVIHYLQAILIQGANEKTFKTQWLF
jgi:hypothetical protein